MDDNMAKFFRFPSLAIPNGTGMKFSVIKIITGLRLLLLSFWRAGQVQVLFSHAPALPRLYKK